jgi:hypothetical protein
VWLHFPLVFVNPNQRRFQSGQGQGRERKRLQGNLSMHFPTCSAYLTQFFHAGWFQRWQRQREGQWRTATRVSICWIDYVCADQPQASVVCHCPALSSTCFWRK